MKRKIILKGQEGALMIVIIITILIIAIAGTASYYLTTASTFAELFKNNNLKAYYLAESGARYAASLVQSDLKNATTTNITALQNHTFTLSTGTFTISIINNPGTAYLFLTSVGTVNPGSWFQTQRTITYKLSKSFDESFDPAKFSTNWNITSGNASIFSGGLVGSDSALRMQTQGGGNPSVVGLAWDGALGIENTGLPDLYAQWLFSNRLLGYDIQVKVDPEPNGTKGTYYMMGLSFRLNTYGDLDPANDTSYGVSFFRALSSNTGAPTWVASLASNFNAIRDGNVYIVFWKRVTSGGTITMLDYSSVIPRWAIKQTFNLGAIILPSVTSSYGSGHTYVCTTTTCNTASAKGNEPQWPTATGATVSEKGGGSGIWRENGTDTGNAGLLTATQTLAPWSTVAVDLKEKYCTSASDTVCTATSGIRYNFVTVYTAQADTYLRGTISWDYSTYFKPVKWQGHLTGQLLANSGSWTTNPPNPETVIDGSLTTALTFGANPVVKPLEVGIHGFYDSSANNDMFYDDFAMYFLSGSPGSNGTYQQYY